MGAGTHAWMRPAPMVCLRDVVMVSYPEKLQEVLEDFAFVEDRNERAALLMEYADRFEDVPERIATRPFPEENHVTRCESDAYVFAEDLPDDTIKFHFAVENPQGISAKAMSVILDEVASGAPLDQVAAIPCDVVYQIFGREISMGKGQGLMGIVSMVNDAARDRLKQSNGTTG
jgi:cysteine desulfuration protein SufE